MVGVYGINDMTGTRAHGHDGSVIKDWASPSMKSSIYDHDSRLLTEDQATVFCSNNIVSSTVCGKCNLAGVPVVPTVPAPS